MRQKDKCGTGDDRAPSPDKGRAGEGLIFLPYNKNLIQPARENRANPTKAENRIWNKVLRQRQLANYKFLRQKPINNFIVDFYCSELRLVVEVDGDSHVGAEEYDEQRSRILAAYGLTVVRYTNGEVFHNIDGVYDDLLRRIKEIQNPNPSPASPCQGRGLAESISK
ncbi:endonuclease domain-containing protein [Geobacter sp.]|uniref:endonuclease domain-containing protein n=1 Tax=Geobacter sp. TaxID=46610 RepID=UPI002633CA4E|nr:endonuclease domain-containing protein [Geobacter sp.]